MALRRLEFKQFMPPHEMPRGLGGDGPVDSTVGRGSCFTVRLAHVQVVGWMRKPFEVRALIEKLKALAE
jgi:hypothetical protein